MSVEWWTTPKVRFCLRGSRRPFLWPARWMSRSIVCVPGPADGRVMRVSPGRNPPPRLPGAWNSENSRFFRVRKVNELCKRSAMRDWRMQWPLACLKHARGLRASSGLQQISCARALEQTATALCLHQTAWRHQRPTPSKRTMHQHINNISLLQYSCSPALQPISRSCQRPTSSS